MFCITYDTTCYADPQRAFDSFMRQLRELFGPVLSVRKNKRIVSHPQPHRVGKRWACRWNKIRRKTYEQHYRTRKIFCPQAG